MNCIMCGSVHPDNYPSTAAEIEAHNELTRANNDRKRRILNRYMEARSKASVKASGVDEIPVYTWIGNRLEIDFGTDGIEQNQRLAYILYQLGGQDEVYEAVNKGIVDHDKWGVCEPCDTNSPFLNNTCLVCGS